MSSKPSNLVPLLALTAATFTSILAFYYLSGQKKGSKDGDNSKPRSQTGSVDAVKPSSKNLSNDSTKGEEHTPILTKISTAEETSSGASTPEKVDPTGSASETIPDQLKETTNNDDAKKSSEVKSAEFSQNTTANDTSKSNNGADPIEEKKTPEVPTEKNAQVSDEATKQTPVADNNAVISSVADSSFDSMKEITPKTEAAQSALEKKTPTLDQAMDEPKQEVVDEAAPPSSEEKAITQESPVAAVAESEKSSDEQPLSSMDTTAEETPAAEAVKTPSNAANEGTETLNSLVTPAKSDKEGEVASTPVPAEMGTPEITKEAEMNEEDLWQFLQREMKQNRRCEGCSAEEGADKFKPCAKCRSALYCSRGCQKKHWKQHKKVCCK